MKDRSEVEESTGTSVTVEEIFSFSLVNGSLVCDSVIVEDKVVDVIDSVLLPTNSEKVVGLDTSVDGIVSSVTAVDSLGMALDREMEEGDEVVTKSIVTPLSVVWVTIEIVDTVDSVVEEKISPLAVSIVDPSVY